MSGKNTYMKTTKSTRKTTKLHPAQRAYALARAAEETAKETAEAQIAARPDLADVKGQTDAEWEAKEIARDEIRENLGCYRLFELRRQAERAMVEWSIAATLAKTNPTPEQRAEIASLPERAYFRPTIWDQLVDSAFRLDARTTPAAA